MKTPFTETQSTSLKTGEVGGKNNTLQGEPSAFNCFVFVFGYFRAVRKHLESRKLTTEFSKGLNNELCSLLSIDRH